LFGALALSAAFSCGGSPQGAGGPGDPPPAEPVPPPDAGAPQKRFTISIAISGDGSGTVEGGPISCGTSCTSSLESDATLTLTARPAPGSEVVAWTVTGCSGNVCTFAVHDDVTVGVNFRRLPPPPPPAPKLCGDDCRVAVDELIAGSAAERDFEAIGFALDSSGRPRVVSPKSLDRCGANQSGFDAVRDGGVWKFSGKTWDRAVSLARTGATLGVLSQGDASLFWRNSDDRAWEPSEPPPFSGLWSNTFVGDMAGRFHALAARWDTSPTVPLYAVWDGKWTATPMKMAEAELQPGTHSPSANSLGMAVTASGQAQVAYWSQHQRSMVDTLYVGNPLGSREVALTSPGWFNDAGISLAMSSQGDVNVPHVLAVRWTGAQGGVYDWPRGSRELVYASKRDGAWSHEVFETGFSRIDCTYAANSDQICQVDELTVWPVAVVTRGADVRMIYTTNHLTGTVVYSCRPGQNFCGYYGGKNSQDLMMAWIKDGHLYKRRLADGFARGYPSIPLSGRERPTTRAQLGGEGRIHLIGEQAVLPDRCGAQIRYLVIE
jgi:hypothetical protein